MASDGSKRRTQLMEGIFVRPSRPQVPNVPRTSSENVTSQQSSAAIPAIPSIPSVVSARNEMSPGFIGGSADNSSSSANKSSNIRPSRYGLSGSPSSSKLVPNVEVRPRSPWEGMVQLGVLVQGNTNLTLCTSRDSSTDIVMFKKLDRQLGKNEVDKLKALAHPNIIKLKYAYLHENEIFLGLEWSRSTLQEILHVHISLKESHVQTLAKLIFEAIKYIGKAGLVHGNVTPRTIRFVGRKAQVVLADFEHCTSNESGQLPNTDLEALALVLIECMDGKPRPSNVDLRQYKQEVRAHRSANRVFGIDRAEQWVGCEQLIDFLDDLLNAEKEPDAKFEKPHTFIQSGGHRSLSVFQELASLECFTLWHPGNDEAEDI